MRCFWEGLSYMEPLAWEAANRKHAGRKKKNPHNEVEANEGAEALGCSVCSPVLRWEQGNNNAWMCVQKKGKWGWHSTHTCTCTLIHTLPWAAPPPVAPVLCRIQPGAVTREVGGEMRSDSDASSYLQYALLLYITFVFSPSLPCFPPPHPACKIKANFEIFQQPQKAPLLCMFAAVPPENHLCFISFACLSPRSPLRAPEI